MTAHVARLPSSTSANSADEASPLMRRSRWRLEVTAVAGSTVAVSRVNLAGKRGCLNPDLLGDPGTYLSRVDRRWRDHQSPITSPRWAALLLVLLAPKCLSESLQR